MKTILAIILSTGLCVKTLAQEMDYSAYLTSSLPLWERAVAKKQTAYDSEKTPKTRFELAKTQFGLLSATMKDAEEDVFDEYVDKTEKHLKALINEGHFVAESKAILSGVYGFKIGYSPWKGMFLGGKASGLASAALEENPNSPIVQKLYANNKYFTPEMWGGDMDLAIESYEKSIQLFEQQRNTDFNWWYLDGFAWLGQAYTQAGDLQSAEATYKKALQVEQEFGWIKYGLLPALAQE